MTTKSLLWRSFTSLALVIGTVLVAGTAQAAPIKVAAVGASTTIGERTPDHTYPQELQRLLGSGYDVQNFGVGGTTMLKKGDKPYWNTARHKAALALVPDIAIFWFAGNESKAQNWDAHKDEFIPDYEELIGQFKALPSKPRTFIVLSLFFKDASGIRREVVTKEVLPKALEVAAKTGSEVIDLPNSDIKNHPEYYPDGIHPNAAGNLAVAKLIQAKILASQPDGGAGSDGPASDGGGPSDAGAEVLTPGPGGQADAAPDLPPRPDAGATDPGKPAPPPSSPPSPGPSLTPSNDASAPKPPTGRPTSTEGSGCNLAGPTPAGPAPAAALALGLCFFISRRRRSKLQRARL